MTAGLIFYWLGWICWVITYFLMKQTKQQRFFTFWILAIIGTSNIFISIGFLDFSIAYSLLFFGGFTLLLQKSQVVYHLLVSFTMMIGYASFLLWEKEAPILSIFPRVYFVSILIVFMSIFLTEGLKDRCIVSIIGVCGGELLHHLFLLYYQTLHTMGDFVFLDTTIVIICFLIILEMMHQLYTKTTTLLHRFKKQYMG